MRWNLGLAISDSGSRFTLPAMILRLPPATQSRMAPSGGVIAMSASLPRTAAVALSTVPSRLTSTERPLAANRPCCWAANTGSQLNPAAPAAMRRCVGSPALGSAMLRLPVAVSRCGPARRLGQPRAFAGADPTYARLAIVICPQVLGQSDGRAGLVNHSVAKLGALAHHRMGSKKSGAPFSMSHVVDPITASVAQHRLRAIVEEMGEAMLRTSYSQILNSSRDFSTALCDPHGRLIAQAEHVPIHVGALPFAARSVYEFFKDRIRPGDVFLLNDPYCG